MNKTILKIIILVMLLAPAAAFGLDIMPVSEIKAGMTGTGYSVFRGAEPEPFKAHIIGVVKRFMADQDLILAELEGAGLEETGIIAGMSGSPVYIDGKLIGAVAYAWPWAKRPIAGITPIEHMMAIWDEMDRTDGEKSASSAPAAGDGYAAVELPGYGKISMAPIATPFYLGGIGPRAAGFMEENLKGYGLVPMQGGGAGDGDVIPGMNDLKPGSVISVPLVSGDFFTAAIGTVTAREGDRVLAFGHPFFGLGKTSLPMGGGSIVTVMPVQSVSFKMGNIGPVLGAMQRDNQAAIAGTVGAKAETFPMKIKVNAPDTGRSMEFNVNIAQIDELQVLLLMISLAEATDRVAGDGLVTVYHKVDGKFRNYDRPFHFEDAYSSPSGAIYFYSLSKLLSLWVSHLRDSKFEEVSVEITVIQKELYANLKGFTLDKSEIHPGDTVKASVRLLPYGEKGKEINKEIEFGIPAAAPAGAYKVSISGGLYDGGPLKLGRPMNFDQWVDFLEEWTPGNSLLVTLTYPEQAMTLEGYEAQGLPATVQGTIALDTPNNMALVDRQLRKLVKTDRVIEGSAMQSFTVTKEY